MIRFPALLLFAGMLFAQQPTSSFRSGTALDALLEEAIGKDKIPGAVVLVGHKGQIVYKKAYGSRALVPRREAMTIDTVFDVASLTKVVATTSAMMRLVERGQVRLGDRVTAYLPDFQGGNSEITVRQLLTHYSGMRPDIDLKPVWSGYETGIGRALIDHPTAQPDTRFVYSDINFLLLGEIVRRVAGKPLPEFVRDEVFRPLGMNETTFAPGPDLISRIAPTEIMDAAVGPLRGIVHDPTARYMGGVAGHAGLFSTASDLARFAEMMLGNGERRGVRIFHPLTVHTFTTQQSPAQGSAVRGLGWDIDSPFSGVRGDLYPIGSYGHTGFTGTSMWIDPLTESYVILLSNSVHPRLRPAITPLRGKVASAAAAGLAVDDGLIVLSHARFQRTPNRAAIPKPVRTARVFAGIDVLAEEKFASLAGKRIGLITNHTGLTRDGKRNIDVMTAGGVRLKALFSPEHGLTGKEDHENVANSKDAATGIPVWSLYSGANRRPSDAMLGDIDALVFDIQDVGTRFYTYMCTMKNAMEEAARRKIEFIVLDRPNPITGLHVEGPMLDPALQSFIGCYEMPIRHGMTVGELAGMMNADLKVKANLKVIRMRGWERGDWFDSTGLIWTDPSPNMRSLNAALLYPGIGMLEGSKVYSVGRGTDAPFEQVGAEWIEGAKLAAYLNERNVPGIRVYPTLLKPLSSNFAGRQIGGVRFVITDRDAFDSVRFGTELGVAIAKLFPGQMTWQANEKLAGSTAFLAAMQAGTDPAKLQALYEAGTQKFRTRRAVFLLY